MPAPLIRDMTPADLSGLAPLRGEPALGSVAPEEELGGRLTRAWVACGADGEPLGYLLGWWVVDELEVLAVGVLPAARRRGVARALLEHAIAATRAAGGRRVTLEVGQENAPARALYEALGFSVFNVRARYYRATGEDALEMERVVEGP